MSPSLQIKFSCPDFGSDEHCTRAAVVTREALIKFEGLPTKATDEDLSHAFLEYLDEAVQDGWEKFENGPGQEFGHRPICVVGNKIVVVSQYLALDV